MIALAKAKAAAHGLQIELQVMDAAFPQLSDQHFEVIICRHLLWALPEPRLVLERWSKFLKLKGRLILIEGFWLTSAGLHSKELIEMLPASFSLVSMQSLSTYPMLWGQPVTDERYAIIANLNNEIKAT
jgi:ubiquinone/menaquinone biosynthesis C-methylase UbiE